MRYDSTQGSASLIWIQSYVTMYVEYVRNFVEYVRTGGIIITRLHFVAITHVPMYYSSHFRAHKGRLTNVLVHTFLLLVLSIMDEYKYKYTG